MSSGYVAVPGGRVWYERLDGGTATPLLLLHGGPGFTHLSFAPLAALAEERPVIWYDQLGSGNSDRENDRRLWTVSRFVDELAAVRAALDLSEVAILGHSWGTMLLAEYLGTNPSGVSSVIFSSPCLDAKRWSIDQKAYVAELPDDLRSVIQSQEDGDEVDPTLYDKATDAFYRRHLCRTDPWPAEVTDDIAAANLDLYEFMWGPTEFSATGTLKNFDATPKLSSLTMSALFLCGRYDEATPKSTESYSRLVPESEYHVFENSGHMTYIDEPSEYIEVVGDFLRSAEQKESRHA